MRVEQLHTEVDTYVAHHLGKLTERVYGGNYYKRDYLGEGRGWMRFQSKRNAKIFTAYNGEQEAIGVSCLSINSKNRHAVLRNTLIDPEYHGMGLGSQLNKERIQHLKDNYHGYIGIVENRAHVIGSFVPPLKEGFFPVALTPDDALTTEFPEVYIREYYVLSALMGNDRFSVSSETEGNTIVDEYLKLAAGSVQVDSKAHTNLEQMYNGQSMYGRFIMDKGAKKGIFPKDCVKNLPLNRGTNTVVLYLTGVDTETVQHLGENGFIFNGIRPWLNLNSADEREREVDKAVPAFLTFSKVGSNQEIIGPTSVPQLKGVPTESDRMISLLYSNTLQNNE